MVQAARSAKQNIAEASKFSGTSKKMELKLLGVARASMEELLQDYEDYLRQNKLLLWPKDHPKALFIRKLTYKSERNGTDGTDGKDGTDLTDEPHEPHATHVTHSSHRSHSQNAPTKKSYETYRPYLEQKTAETAANTLICLIRQASYLLDRLLRALAEEFKSSGGFTERLYNSRKNARERGKSQPSTPSNPTKPSDPSDRWPG